MQSKDIRISLVIPVYNEERYLPACLDAVAGQTVALHEVIVVDNNCTDKTAEIARRYPFVTLLQEPRQGRAYAQDTGFRHATGDVLGRIDADARLHADWAETVCAKLGSADAITGRGRFYDMPAPRTLSWLQVLAYQYLQWPFGRTFVLWGANMAMTKTAWQSIAQDMLAHPSLDEDIIVSLQLKRRGKRIAFEPSLLVDASLRRNQLSPVEIVRYMSTWPRDYWVCKRYVQAVLIAVLTGVVIVVGVPLAVGARVVGKIRPRSGN